MVVDETKPEPASPSVLPAKNGNGNGKHPGGRKPKVIDMKLMEELAAEGLTEEQIAQSIGVSPDTLAERKKNPEFLEVLHRGKAAACRVVSNKLMGLCKEGNLGAIIWWEKTRAGVSEPSEGTNRIHLVQQIAVLVAPFIDETKKEGLRRALREIQHPDGS